jgi:hypothetical protein
MNLKERLNVCIKSIGHSEGHGLLLELVHVLVIDSEFTKLIQLSSLDVGNFVSFILDIVSDLSSFL